MASESKVLQFESRQFSSPNFTSIGIEKRQIIIHSKSSAEDVKKLILCVDDLPS